MKTEAIGFARASADDPRIIEGLAVPYGVVSRPTELLPGSGDIVREAWAPASFSADVASWDARTDGRRMPFRPRHGQPAVGSVIGLRDSAEGVYFQARIRAGARGDDYLADVADGLNGISVEGMWNEPPRRLKDGTVLHRSGKLHGIAGSDNPAYDAAHIALRDMEEPAMTAEATPTPEAAPAPVIAAPVAAERAASELASLAPFAGSQAVITRPEAVYGPRSEFSWLGDSFAAERGDSAARERQQKHGRHLADIAGLMEREGANRLQSPLYAERAGDLLSTEIPGAYPNDYLPGLLTPRILKGRPMGDFYQRVPIADARPRIFAKVTTSSTVAVQSAEGAALSTTDIATTAVTANPLMYGATIDVSRQVLDGGDPAALGLVYQDLLEAYAQASETVIKAAVEAGSTASGTAITAATPYAGVLANVITHYSTRFKGATGAFIPSALFAVLAAQGDTTGRPFLPMIGAVNSDGQTLADESSLALAVLTAKSYLSYASTANVCVFGRPADFVIYESPIATVQYDQVVGPQAVRVGLWAYLAIGTRLGSLKVTAA